MTAPPVFGHRATGTPEHAWAGSEIAVARPLRLSGIGRVVVVAAHPDDETLGAGGLIARAEGLGLPVTVVIASDGEGSHPGSPTHPPARLARRRAREVRAAVTSLAARARLVRGRLPDGELGQRERALHTILTRALGPSRPDVLLVAPWAADGHPDHDAAGRVAARVAADGGAALLQYPIWAWQWARPGDPRLSAPRLSALHLTSAEWHRKQRALLCYRSQLERLGPSDADAAVLTPEFLQHFHRRQEIFVGSIAPDDAPGGRTLPRDYFDRQYRAGPDPWGFEGRWYERRKRAITMASLPRERFGSAFEPGCSIGVLTQALADRCDRLLATDIAAAPLEVARRRLARRPTVTLEQRRIPDEWPPGTFDLVVLSEVGYYCSAPDLRRLVASARRAVAPGGVLLACHWRHPVPDYPLSGDSVHELLLSESGMDVLARHEEADFLLHVLVHPPVRSVAAAEGLVT